MDDKTKTLCNVECLEKYKQVRKAPGFDIKKFFFSLSLPRLNSFCCFTPKENQSAGALHDVSHLSRPGGDGPQQKRRWICELLLQQQLRDGI